MRILFVADGRSPIAINWISYFVEAGHEVLLASTYPCRPNLGLASMRVLPLPFSSPGESGGGGSWGARRWLGVGWRTRARQWLVPLTLARVAQPLHEMIEHLKPDLVHAMRIPYEGMLAALADPSMPLLVSVWGNDFSLHAKATPLLRRYTHLVMQRADALHSDCQRDQRLAQVWGFSQDRPRVVLPGAGGVQLDIFYPREEQSQQTLTVINPRGFRAYVRNDTFFKAIPRVLQRQPEARFICPAMQGEAQAERWVSEMGIRDSVVLLPRQTRPQMAELFRRAQIVASITTHDGTPNSLLEAMACGCFPITGDIETIHEWLTPGENGLLVEPGDPAELAQAILSAWEQTELRRKAARINRRLVQERADYRKVMAQAERFYQSLVGKVIIN
jgi:glycosyltransferase involved in cell wall biosynthesis